MPSAGKSDSMRSRYVIRVSDLKEQLDRGALFFRSRSRDVSEYPR